MKMDESPLVSIIIPTYKRPHMLRRSINSVIAQTYKNIEIIIVDDNHPEDSFRKETEKIMLEYHLDKRVHYLKHSQNVGGSAARNTGIINSHGLYITFLDDDDEYHKDKITKQVNVFLSSKQKKLAMVFCGMALFDFNNKLVEKIGIYLNDRRKLFEQHMKGGIFGTPMIMVPRTIFDEIGNFKNLKCGQDYEFVLRILSGDYAVCPVPEELVYVYHHNEQRITGSNQDIKYLKYLWNIKKKYLFQFSRYKQKKIKLEYEYCLYRCYCLKREYKFALAKLIRMWGQCIWDFKLFYAPYFLLFDQARLFKLKQFKSVIALL